MKIVAILISILLASIGPCVGAPWGYFVNESNTSQIMGVVPDAQRVMDSATPLGNDTWEISNITYWKSWNNAQWHMKPYPPLPFKMPEITVSHITIWESGDHYLIGARMPFL